MNHTFAALAVIVFLSGCAGPQQADYGPFPDRYEEVITAALHERLKDPYSIQDLSISPPVQYAQLVGLINGGYKYGWRSCVTFNSKNSFGAYTGLETYSAVIIDGYAVGYFYAGCQ